MRDGLPHQTLLGVTGSGKTFTIANVIQQVDRPTLDVYKRQVLMHPNRSVRNYTLATNEE